MKNNTYDDSSDDPEDLFESSKPWSNPSDDSGKQRMSHETRKSPSHCQICCFWYSLGFTNKIDDILAKSKTKRDENTIQDEVIASKVLA